MAGLVTLVVLEVCGLAKVDLHLLALGLRRVPPLERRHLLRLPVLHGEGRLRLEVRERHPLDGLLVGVLEPVDELAAPLGDASVGARLLDVGLEVHVLLLLLLLLLALGLVVGHEGVLGGRLGAEALRLLALQDPLQQLAALLGAPGRDHDLLRLHVLLALEGEAAGHEAVHHHTDGPDVDLQAVVHGEELGRPVGLRPALGVEPIALLQVAHGPEVAEEDAALRVLDGLPVHKVVVTLDVPVHDLLLVEPGDALDHLLAHVGHDADGQHAQRLPVELHALDHVAPLVEVHDHADECLLVVDIMELHDAGMGEPVEHLRLLLDFRERGLDLVDHLDCVLLLRPLLFA
mmetsp:Transcript_12477/g.25334  ORF Transcript_12477/g.25334 Transcript_12477/m.25334 type:complete len:347 (-) Transcript_12477:161-1201(-)